MSDEKIVVKYKVGDEDITLTPKIVQEYLTNGVQITLPEFKMFTELCKARKLNPFLKEAYVIKFGNNPAQIVVGKDAVLKRAINNPKFNGREQGIIVVNDKNEVEERRGTFKLPNDVLVGAWAKVYRKDWDYPVYVTVGFDEVAQRKGSGDLNANWSKKGATMVEKVALVRALREAFVEDLGGMIEEDEIWKDEAQSQPKPNQNDPLETEIIEAETVTEIDFNAVS